MKTTIALALATLGCVADANLKSDVQTMNSKMVAAIKKLDMKTIDAITAKYCAPDFKYTDNGKTQGREGMLADMKMGFSMFRKVLAADAKSLKVSEKGGKGASVSSHYTLWMIIMQDNKVHKMDMKSTSNETWTKNGGKWALSSMKVTNVKLTMDGKPFDMPQMTGPGH